jgi:hypothetical protein
MIAMVNIGSSREIVLMCHADACNYVGDAGSLLGRELSILEVDIVNDLGDPTQRSVLEANSL